MINHPAFTIAPWSLRLDGPGLDVLAQTESLFALSNGYIGWRGTLDEGEPHVVPGCYLNGVYESVPLPYSEPGYGYPGTGEVVANVSNGKLIRLFVDDAPLDIRHGTLHSHTQELDFRAGVLRRELEWTSPAGTRVKISSARLVSLVHRPLAAIDYRVEPVSGPARITLQSELVTNEPVPPATDDPRAASALAQPFRALEHFHHRLRVHLSHSTIRSRQLVAVAMDHQVTGPGAHTSAESYPDQGRMTATAQLGPGQELRITKFVAYASSRTPSAVALRDQVSAALTTTCQAGWDSLLRDQRRYLDDFWERADVTVEGDPGIQQAVRFGLFQLMQAAARAEGGPIAAKGLTGPGYNGHTFWDTEMFVLPVLETILPQAVADALRWRHSMLPAAQARASQLGLRGGAFPWRTISGTDCSGYWPASTAAFHLNADIAMATARYVATTGDAAFEAGPGAELLVATARLWMSLGRFDDGGRFHIDGVTGPDEYSALMDDNLYTNLLAQRNLRAAAQVCRRCPEQAAALGTSTAEVQQWCDAAAQMYISYDSEQEVHAQAARFTAHGEWDFAATGSADYPLLLHFPYFELYRKQVVKQADVVLAMQWCPAAFTPAEKARNFAYYEQRTVRDSSLSASSQAVLAAETGSLELAYGYLAETALLDLADLEHNTRDGLHLAALAGGWLALVQGFGGFRADTVSFAPRLPPGLTRVAFAVRVSGRLVAADITAASTSYRLIAGAPITVRHHGEELSLAAGESIVRANEPAPSAVPVTQPAGRAPARRQ